jgi:hypothetical protein
MTVLINFNVRNPDWYWSADQMNESGDYYEEWKALNEDKVPKHLPSLGFRISFDVIDVQVNMNTIYDLKFSDRARPEIIQSVKLEDMTHVVFSGGDDKAEVVVSNEIIHSYLGAKKSGKKYYYYFFIKEDAEYERLTDTIWVSKKQAHTFY